MIIIKNINKEMCFIPITEQFKLVFCNDGDGDNDARKLTIRFLKSVYNCPCSGFTSTDIGLWKYDSEKLLEKVVNIISFKFEDYLKCNRHLKDHLEVDGVELTEDLIMKLDKKYGGCTLIKDTLTFGYGDCFKIWDEIVKEFETELYR